MLQRLDKILAGSGLLSRSQAREALRAGRVQVHGVPVRDGAEKVDPEQVQVTLDGVAVTGGTVVLLLNKPAGYVTSTQDPRDPTVMELLPQSTGGGSNRWGGWTRRRRGSCLTDDGELAHRLISPVSGAKAVLCPPPRAGNGEDVEAFAAGLVLGDGTQCLPAKLEPLGPGESLVTICEGKYHQVRRMLASRGMPVTYLERQAEGQLTLDGVLRGHFRILSEAERRLFASPRTGGSFWSFSLKKYPPRTGRSA